MSTVHIISLHGINSSVLMATADQDTVVGNGTLELPLRVAGGGASFIAEYTDLTDEPPLPGRPVVVEDADPAVGIASVRLATAGLPTPRPFAVGLIIAARTLSGAIREVTVQHAGTVTLTTAQWDVVTGQTGGLTPGPYYLSFGFDDLGHLTTVVTADVGRFVALAGVALNSVTMQLAIPQLPLEVS